MLARQVKRVGQLLTDQHSDLWVVREAYKDGSFHASRWGRKENLPFAADGFDYLYNIELNEVVKSDTVRIKYEKEAGMLKGAKIGSKWKNNAVPVVEKKPSVLDEAVAVAGNGAERARDYGHPYENHERIARFWNAYDQNKRVSGPDTPKDVALKMVLLKIAREQNTHKRDNLVDIAGYILCAEQIVEREKNG